MGLLCLLHLLPLVGYQLKPLFLSGLLRLPDEPEDCTGLLEAGYDYSEEKRFKKTVGDIL
jgi:hypothetical protein